MKIIIIGAGPAGLTAGASLVEKGHQVIILEKDDNYVGGISRTVKYKGFRFDIGGHRFFSKSAEITDWWHNRLPNDFIKVRRLSRIYYRGKFFDYPLKAFNALFNLGIWTSFLCVLSYLKVKLRPIPEERSFQDWVSNRFGKKLFSIFFKTYTEKVWGRPCDQISADWAAQRIKGLSLVSAVQHALFPQKTKKGEVVKTLIEEFQYPRLGPGMMWEKTRDDILASERRVEMGTAVKKIEHDGMRVIAVETEDGRRWEGDSFIVSMPLQETVRALAPAVPPEALAAASRLEYRDFLTVALMVRRENVFPDNWIYIHDPGVKLGRIQNFNNWSRALTPEAGVTCLGLEYFCFEGDEMWNASDEMLIDLGKRELRQLGLVSTADEIFDGCVVRMPKAYPVYGPNYADDVALIQRELEKLSNLQVIGRNGMHRYNNMDHSMMTALLAARNVEGARFDLWQVNTDAEYHEEKQIRTHK
ncbi:protoporphyrinogen oxidase [Ereboglobus sp. PH5-10]|uniref:NAD(P)/FAD-dependent oxidoreductase n=1 Tax=Ereboglobus sp. PH5-10 TaxID=2940629 RepID=UPI002405251E|nr:NAD(P)/FAD-dependent oxidoreductase [Ereboglobus sp. PH5-10]MDF9828427.1 protoporphyrinogen oxidase [Ereboglobus sp. PH5-10]